MIKTETILNMNNKDIAEFLTHEEIQKVEEKYRTLSNFVGVYQDAARLSNEDEFITPSEYLEIMLEQDEEHEEDMLSWDL